LKPLADFGLGSIPIGKNTPAQQVAPLVWLILLLVEWSGLVQVPLSISVTYIPHPQLSHCLLPSRDLSKNT
ncbi:MAG: hypothetical protein ACKO1I_16690, partial [Microcystis aeruginosa]